ncbi:hypothetical protein [Flavobacterium sp.]|jgi:hypothetical protein|uniref:hypothetical protein n=1 Tax=Flavobacterium sp. TaxID=239 RepID=UPI0037C11CF7
MFYKAQLAMTEEGMQVLFEEFHPIHETKCYSYCVRGWNYPVPLALKRKGETDLRAAKRMRYKITRIHKDCSRIAFATKEQAFKQLIFLKKRQINHMRRDIDLLTYFLERTSESGLQALTENTTQYNRGTIHTLPDSAEKLQQYYVFD